MKPASLTKSLPGINAYNKTMKAYPTPLAQLFAALTPPHDVPTGLYGAPTQSKMAFNLTARPDSNCHETQRMPLNYVKGDATKPNGTGNRIITHCCNDRGFWNAGFVKALSHRWSEPERAYRQWAAG